jgi:hypothetical protein
VQALRRRGTARAASRLPEPRSDTSAVTIGGTAYLLGGYDGASYDARVLATTDGRHFRGVATLPVPVRYPAVAGAGTRIWVFGGQTRFGLTDAVQQVSLVTGKAAVVGHLPAPVTGAAAFALGGHVYVAGGQVLPRGRPGLATSGDVLAFDPRREAVAPAGRLPVPVANAAAAVVAGTAYLVGGNNGLRQVPTVTELRPAARATAIGGTGPGGPVLASEPWLGPAHSRGHLAPHSDPSVLPGDVLIADNQNNRLLIVDPHGRIRWKFPRRGDLTHGQRFLVPDDAFFSPDGRDIIATEEDYSVISVIDIARHKIVYRYGTPGVPGSGNNHAANPDDALMMPGGMIITADIENCRLLLLAPPSHRPRRVIGQTGICAHDPPHLLTSPNGAFPTTSGTYLVTEINGDWVSEIGLDGHLLWSTHPPGVAYPSDTVEVYPGRYLTTDYSSAGQVVEFDSRGRLLWRFRGLDHPSLALPLPNGDILVNDDYNDRVGQGHRRRRWSAVTRDRLIAGHDLYPERQERDRNDLEVREPQRDPDDRQAQQDPGHQVGDRKPPAEQDDPDDVADQRADAHPLLPRGDGPAERPQHIVRDPERGDTERNGDDQEEQDETDQPCDRIGDGHPDAAEDQPDHVQDRSHRIPQTWSRAPPALRSSLSRRPAAGTRPPGQRPEAGTGPGVARRPARSLTSPG